MDEKEVSEYDYDDDFYSDDAVEESLSSDSISATEEGFMLGYLAA
ncbi:MAG: hypothetical protein ABH879_02475 [archaeon]